jgi:hypothetical protein
VVNVSRRISIALVALALLAAAAPLPASICAGASTCPLMKGMAPGCPACVPHASVRAEMPCCSPEAAPATAPAAIQPVPERPVSAEPGLEAGAEVAVLAAPAVVESAAVLARAERRHGVGLNVLHAVFRI